MRRNHIDEYAIFWGIVQGGLVIADDLARRALRSTLAAACITWTVCGIAAGLTLLAISAAWACVHPRDRRALVGAARESARTARGLPARVIAVAKLTDRQTARLICAVVDWLDAERQRWELRQGRPFRVAIDPVPTTDPEPVRDPWEDWQDEGSPVGRAA